MVSVADGDTITILDSAKVQHRIRIHGIDAPEKGQAFGQRSKENMSRLAFGKDANAECRKTDRYQRQVCVIWVRPPCLKVTEDWLNSSVQSPEPVRAEPQKPGEIFIRDLCALM